MSSHPRPLSSRAESSSGATQARITGGNLEILTWFTHLKISHDLGSTIHLSVQIIRHCFSQIWAEPIRNCISLMGQREKIHAKESLWIWNDPGMARPDCTSQNYLPFSDIFGICAKYLSPNLRLTNFDKPLMFAVKLGKLVWILADSYWLWGAILQPAWCIIILGSPTSLCPVAGAAHCLEKLLVEFEIRDHSKPVSHIIPPPHFSAESNNQPGVYLYLSQALLDDFRTTKNLHFTFYFSRLVLWFSLDWKSR